MKRGPFLVATGLLGVVLALCAAAYAYDAATPQRLADGLSVNGVGIGGLTRAQGKATRPRALVAPLQRSITIVLPSGPHMHLTPGELRVLMRLEPALDQAERYSR